MGVIPATPAIVTDEPDAAPVRIGVLAHRRDSLQRWQPTAAYLDRAIPGHRFVVEAFDLSALEQAVARSEIDLVITNPGSYIALESRYGATRILTLKSREGRAVLTAFGSVIFTRSGRADIRELSDLRGKSFAAVDPEAFGGFLIAWQTLRQHGVNPYRDFSELLSSARHRTGSSRRSSRARWTPRWCGPVCSKAWRRRANCG